MRNRRHQSSRQRVLIIDNAPYAREMLGDLLKRHGYEVVGEAEDNQQALELYKALRPDIVTLDLFLTGEHGFTTLKAIRRFDPRAHIVVISGIGHQEMIDKAIELGARAYVLKTEDWSELGMALSRSLGLQLH